MSSNAATPTGTEAAIAEVVRTHADRAHTTLGAAPSGTSWETLFVAVAAARDGGA